MVKKIDNNQEKYEYERHHFYLDKHAGKQVCANCGLVALRNKASQWCVDQGCNYKLHASYPGTIKKLTKLFDF